MNLKNQLIRTPYLVFFIVLIAIGVGTASALITITLAGNVVITDELEVGGNSDFLASVIIADDLQVHNDLFVDGELEVTDNLFVGGELDCDGCINTYSVHATTSVASGDFGHITTVQCDSGDMAMGGGVSLPRDIVFRSSQPIDSENNSGSSEPATGWQGAVDNDTGNSADYRVSVICLDFNPSHIP